MRQAFISIIGSIFILLPNVSCDSDIRKTAKKMNEERFSAYLENQDKQVNQSADSVRNLVGQYSHTLPQSFSDITLVNIDTVNVTRDVWCKMYFSSSSVSDSLKLATKIDSILTNCEPFKGWLKYGKYAMNVEFWCYMVNNRNDTIRITSIPKRNY